jgi:hypothetical protein
MLHLEVDKKRSSWRRRQYARHDSLDSPVRFSLELQQVQAFEEMVISVGEVTIGGLAHEAHG